MEISLPLQTTIDNAFSYAQEKKHEFLTCEHLLMQFLNDTEVQEMFSSFKINITLLKNDLNDFLDLQPQLTHIENPPTPQFSMQSQFALQVAANHVHSAGKKELNCIHVMIAFYRLEESHANYFLQKLGINKLKLTRYISHSTSKKETQNSNTEDINEQTEQSALERFCINLTQLAKEKKLDPLIGREKELDRMKHVLARRKKNNPILVGEAGVGKTALLEGFSNFLLTKKAPNFLQTKTVLSLQLSTLIAGTKFRGEFEERIEELTTELKNKKNIILAIDEIHSILGTGAVSTGTMDLAGLLKPLFSDGTIQCIGTTTANQFRSIFQKDHALASRFQKVVINEPTEAECITILEGLKNQYETFHNVSYLKDSIEAAVTLSNTYIKDRCLPDKAIDLIDEAGASLKLASTKTKKVTQKQIEKLVCKIAQIPELKVQKKESTKLKELKSHLKKEIFGQNHAIEKIVTAIQLHRAGLTEENKPIGSFIFAGPTGVGKTELAKQLASKLDISFLRYDMSEYMEKHTVSKFIGSPPGYVGYDQGGQLTEAIYKNPHSVILLDEIEKAHPDLINILLQIMDHATLTDSAGRKINFRHCIIIMTTNSGAKESSESPIGFTQQDTSFKSLKAIENQFNPEFRNRLSAIIAFNSLPKSIVTTIANKCLNELKTQVSNKNIILKWNSKIETYIAQKGYDPKYGARNIKRIIDQDIKQPLSNEILFGKLVNGGTITITLVKNSIVLK
jgi:ATP-dependent Clp protease ATP-binding subunit ClpA